MAGRVLLFLTILFLFLWRFFQLYPEIDLAVSSLYYKNGTWIGQEAPLMFIREVYYRGSMLLGAYAVIMAIVSFWRPFKLGAYFYRFFAILVVVGNLIIVNRGFKEFFGRARPFQTQDFGGDKLFTPPPFFPVGQCAHNCSFVSGEASAAMILILIGVALCGASKRGKFWVWIAILPMAWLRIMAGMHFFSDVVMAMVLTAMVYWFQLWVTTKMPKDLWGSWRDFGADFTSLFRRRGNSDAG